jgi:hypothetical protein
MFGIYARQVFEAGLPDFSRYNKPKTGKYIPNDHKIYRMAVKWTKWPKIYQYLPLQDPPKFTLFGIFHLKIYHLATLV